MITVFEIFATSSTWCRLFFIFKIVFGSMEKQTGVPFYSTLFSDHSIMEKKGVTHRRILALSSWILALSSRRILALSSWILALSSWILALSSWILALSEQNSSNIDQTRRSAAGLVKSKNQEPDFTSYTRRKHQKTKFSD